MYCVTKDDESISLDSSLLSDISFVSRNVELFNIMRKNLLVKRNLHVACQACNKHLL